MLSSTLKLYLLLAVWISSWNANATPIDDEAAVITTPDGYRVKKFVFQAVVDHYNFRNTEATFPLRYYVNDDYWNYNNNSTGSVFFYAGNEADILQFVNNSGFMFEAAEEFQALVVFAEHRYYGESLIRNDSNDDDDDYYSYLTVEQAMSDFNTLNVHMRQSARWNMQTNTQTPFVVFGGSYGGNLALWLRLKNPNLWAGAIASSATPLKHILRETNNFNRIETEVYANVSTQCPDLIRQGWKELYDDIESSSGRDRIASILGLCQVPDDGAADEIYGFVSGALETMVQYGYPYPNDFYNPVPGYPFKMACEGMLVSSSTTTDGGLGALRAAMNVYYNYTGQAGPCYSSVSSDAREYWSRMGARHAIFQHNKRRGAKTVPQMSSASAVRRLKDDLRKKALPIHSDQRVHSTDDSWGYQTCTEVYQPMPTDGITDFELPFTPNKADYFANCRERYGVEPRPNWEEMHFMGDDISAGSNIFLASGQFDPWRASGIQSVPKGSPDSIIVRIIENGAHHFDLRGSHPLDPPSVVQVRKEERIAMHRWISEWRDRHSSCQETF